MTTATREKTQILSAFPKSNAIILDIVSFNTRTIFFTLTILKVKKIVRPQVLLAYSLSLQPKSPLSLQKTFP
jgi:hypothetical protein